RRMAETGNWEGAAKVWIAETGHPNRKVAARATYNRAISAEIEGQLDEAMRWARQAYEQYGLKQALRYVRILEDRQYRNRVLELQEGEHPVSALETTRP